MAKKESFFKYMTSDIALTVLRDFTLKFSNTLNFNDPFDYNPALTKIGLSKYTKRIGEKYGVRITRKKAYENYKLLISEQFRSEASKEFSVTCFSKSPYIIPMWAHYADLHSGCVLGFCEAPDDELEAMLESYEWMWSRDTDYLIPYDVRYTDDRPTIFNSEGITNTQINGFDACIIKAKAWEYEQEVRVIKTKSEGIHQFKKSQIRSVRFGLKTNPMVRDEIIKTVQKLNIEKGIRIKLFDVGIDHREFKLNDIKC